MKYILVTIFSVCVEFSSEKQKAFNNLPNLKQTCMSYDKQKINTSISNIVYALNEIVHDLLTQILLVKFVNNYKETARDALNKTWKFEEERLK